ncbi:MAG TPA: STAS domain-containing protein [Geobacteraceae bacterium]|nr:STAS domain-containing protein [Geobacteraceae bacterium]
MHLAEHIKGEIAVVSLSGELLDDEDESILEQKIISLTSDNIKKIILDFAKLNRINSQGLAALLSAVKNVRSTGGDIRISGLDEHLNSIFAITRLVRIFDTYETVGRAMASYTH